MGGAAEIYKEASHGDISMVGYGRLLLFHFLPTAGSPTHTRVYFFFFFLLIFIGVQLLYSVMLVSTIQKNESATHVHICIPFGLPSLSGHHRPLKEFPVL